MSPLGLPGGSMTTVGCLPPSVDDPLRTVEVGLPTSALSQHRTLEPGVTDCRIRRIQDFDLWCADGPHFDSYGPLLRCVINSHSLGEPVVRLGRDGSASALFPRRWLRIAPRTACERSMRKSQKKRPIIDATKP